MGSAFANYRGVGLLLFLLLSGCGDDGSSSGAGGGPSPGDDGGSPVVTPASPLPSPYPYPYPVAYPSPFPSPPPLPESVPGEVLVVPSLGRMLNADVEWRALDGSVLAKGNTGTSGRVQFSLQPELQGPFRVVVCGNDSASYFDEAIHADVPLSSTQCLSAFVTDLFSAGVGRGAGVGVTPLTNAAAAFIDAQFAGTPTVAQIDYANDYVRERVAPELADILSVPALVGSDADLDTLVNTSAGQYALRLALLARAGLDLAQSRNTVVASPAYDVAMALAADLRDSSFDGRDGDAFIVLPVYDIFHLKYRLEAARDVFAQESDALSALVGDLGGVSLVQDVETPPGSDPLLSLQGNYSGNWSLEYVVAYPEVTNRLLADTSVPFHDLLAHALQGAACTVTNDNGVLTVDGYPVAFGYRELPSKHWQDQWAYEAYHGYPDLMDITFDLGGFALLITLYFETYVELHAAAGSVSDVYVTLSATGLGGIIDASIARMTCTPSSRQPVAD